MFQLVPIRGAALVLGMCSVLMAGCTSESEPVLSPESDVLPGSFGLCSTGSPPKSEPDGSLVLSSETVVPGAEVVVSWSLEDPEEFVGPDLLAECWTGSGWIPVWITRNVFSQPVAELVAPGEELFSNDEGFTDREGMVVIPLETPPGVYRIGRDHHDARITVRETGS